MEVLCQTYGAVYATFEGDRRILLKDGGSAESMESEAPEGTWMAAGVYPGGENTAVTRAFCTLPARSSNIK